MENSGPFLTLLILFCLFIPHGIAATDEKKGPALECIGSIGEDIQAFAVQGHTLFVGGGYTLRAIDISDPAKPREVGWLRMDGKVSEILARVPALYVTVSQISAWLVLVDASNPHRMKIMDKLGGGNKRITVKLMGDYLYSSTDGKFDAPGYAIYSIRNPLRPIIHADGSPRESAHSDYASDGKRLYTMKKLKAENDRVLIAVDDCSTKPAKQIGKRVFRDEDCPAGFRLDKKTGKIWLGDEKTSGSLAVGNLNTGGPIWTLSRAGDDLLADEPKGFKGEAVGFPELNGTVKSAGKNMAVGEMNHGLGIFDTSNPRRWTLLGRYGQTFPMNAIKVADRMVYGVGESRLSIIDCRKPEHPKLVGGCDLPSSVSACAVENDTVYVSGDSGQLYAVDVKKSAAPVLLGSMKLSAPPQSMAASGNHLFLASGDAGLKVIDVTNPAAMKQAGEYLTPGPCLDLATSETLVYALTPKVLCVLDASGAGAPKLLGKLAHQFLGKDEDYDPEMENDSLKRLGNLLYIVHSHNESLHVCNDVNIVNVANPVAPELLKDGIHENEATESSSPVRRDLKPKFAGWLLGLPSMNHSTDGTEYSSMIYDLSDPAHPILLDQFYGVTSICPPALFKNIIYEADEEGGLLLLRLAPSK